MVLALVGDSTITSALPPRALASALAFRAGAFLAGALATGACAAGVFAAGAFFFVLLCFSRVAMVSSVAAEVTAWSNSGGNKKVAPPSRCKAAHSKSFQDSYF